MTLRRDINANIIVIIVTVNIILREMEMDAKTRHSSTTEQNTVHCRQLQSKTSVTEHPQKS